MHSCSLTFFIDPFCLGRSYKLVKLCNTLTILATIQPSNEDIALGYSAGWQCKHHTLKEVSFLFQKCARSDTLHWEETNFIKRIRTNIQHMQQATRFLDMTSSKTSKLISSLQARFHEMPVFLFCFSLPMAWFYKTYFTHVRKSETVLKLQ